MLHCRDNKRVKLSKLGSDFDLKLILFDPVVGKLLFVKLTQLQSLIKKSNQVTATAYLILKK